MVGRHLAILFVLAMASGAPATARTRDLLVEPGVSIHVVDEGRDVPSRPALVLIPGWRLPATIWSSQIARFSDDRRVIAVDSRSQGGSSMAGEGNTPERRAQALRSVLQQLGAQQFVLVGWSQGVQDVAAYANRFGTKDVAGLVLVDPTISRGADAVADQPEAAVRTLQSMRSYNADPQAFTRGMLGAITTKAMPAAQMDALVRQMLKTPTSIGSAMLIADLLGVDRSSATERFDRPTLVIASAQSWELSDQKAMAARIPGAQFRVIADAGHMVFLDQPKVFNEMMSLFLDGLDARPLGGRTPPEGAR